MDESASSSFVPPPLPPQVLLSAIVDSSDDAIISKDLNGIITSWNKGAERIFGYGRDEVIGRSITLLLPPERLHEEADILERLRRGERVDHYETLRRHKSGGILEVSLTISPVKDVDGRIIGASKIARDITAQKKSQRALLQLNEELQRANRMNTEFLAVISHELRTPLNAIAGWVQILQEPDVAPDLLATGLANIERNMWAQAKLIDDLLDVNRIISGKLKLEMTRVDLAAVIAAAIEAVSPAAAAKAIHLTNSLSDVRGAVMGDAARLQQIIWNLLSNAVKFTSKDGRIHVSLERVNSHVEISVSDTGKGIAPEFLPFVFERFRQEDSSSTRQHGGLGIGLSIVKQLTELHGGDVRASSGGQGQGATFTIQLPVIAFHHGVEREVVMRRDAEVDEQAVDSDLRGVKVLVVDDEADAREIILHILNSKNADVRCAACMNEALEIFPKFCPHVAITDIGMPERDGYEFMRRLRQLPKGNVPAIALTALARPEDRTRALRAGFQIHLPKPIHADELVAVVMNLSVLRHRASEDPS